MNPTREFLLMRLYERNSPFHSQVYVKNGIMYKRNKNLNSITASSSDGLTVTSDGTVWVVVPDKNDPGKIKAKFRMGNISGVPKLPKNPTKEQQRMYDAKMAKIQKAFDRLPDLEKIYNS